MSHNDLDQQLQKALQEHTKHWTAPSHLQYKIIKEISATKGGRTMKKWLISVIVTALLLIPVGAYAGYHYLADAIYGSKEAVVQLGGTEQQYERLEKKLLMAKNELSTEEYSKFMTILKEYGQFYLKYADANGNIDPKTWSKQEQARYKVITEAMIPLFERLKQLDKQATAKSSMDEPAFWENALKKAKTQFTEAEYTEFKQIYETMWSYKSIVTDEKDGHLLHWDRLSKEQQAEVNEIRPKLLKYLEQLGYKAK
jgi:hypothetical protein